LKCLISQNFLCQAGYPQHHLNEIHGAWYDPSNPVVMMSGQLRTDLFEWLLEWEQKADLLLVLGTSLSGMNADRMVSAASKRHRKGEGLGTVIISLQKTPYDCSSSLRIFSTLDKVFFFFLFFDSISFY
jgi:NAD-dependent SIR2 family protein deacetylase